MIKYNTNDLCFEMENVARHMIQSKYDTKMKSDMKACHYASCIVSRTNQGLKFCCELEGRRSFAYAGYTQQEMEFRLANSLLTKYFNQRKGKKIRKI